ncbi:MAG: class I SAM-dependent methyltransferase [Xanthomonadales bacterium]|nr:class I SAM-dependent methyltransferase [Xanthomonadales bacterium]
MTTENTHLAKLALAENPSGERNKLPILEVLKEYLNPDDQVLEIGSGGGMHAIYFTQNLPAVRWQMTEMPQYMKALEARFIQQANSQMSPPVSLDCRVADWGLPRQYNAVFSANTTHIMSWQAVCGLMHGVQKALKPGGLFLLYGPFRYNGEDTAASNTAFHEYLKNESPEMGLRDFQEMAALANLAGLQLIKDIPMPANNRILIFKHEQ